QGQVPHSHIVEKVKAIANLAQDATGDEPLTIAQFQAVEHTNGFGDRQVDVFADRASLHPHSTALRFESLSLASRARPQRAVGLQTLLFEPGALIVAASQVWNEPFEARTERIFFARSSL